ncbi:MAG TPA: hypothetical protein VES01_10050 [Dermatophilaceae bacterium]|nr:hypothetical protein [Dermatophilaceae bacterium]
MSEQPPVPDPIRAAPTAPTAAAPTGDDRIDAILRAADLATPFDSGAPLGFAELEDLAARGERVRDQLQRRLTDLDGA